MVSAEYSYLDATHPIEIKESVSLVEEGAIVDLIVTSVISKEDGMWVYSPNFLTYAYYANVLKFFTDYDVADKGLDEVYRTINESDLIDVLDRHVSPIQAASIRSAVEQKINYFIQLHIAEVTAHSQVDSLAADLRALLAKWDKKLEKAFKPRVIEKVLKNISQIDGNGQSLSEAVVSAYNANKVDAGNI